MKYLYNNKHWPVNKEYNIDKLLYLMIDRPSEIEYESDLLWFNNKKQYQYQYHRNYDLPSEIVEESLYWFIGGMFHRKNNKPAVIYSDGDKEYYINDKFIKIEQLK